ncbi:hypothetical protein ACLBR5_01210 [Escherichia coli]
MCIAAKGIVDLPLQPMSDISEFSPGVDVVFLATAHEVSHDLAPQFLEAGCVVFDLSGAFRVNDATFYGDYGFTHQYPANCWNRQPTVSGGVVR